MVPSGIGRYVHVSHSRIPRVYVCVYAKDDDNNNAKVLQKRSVLLLYIYIYIRGESWYCIYDDGSWYTTLGFVHVQQTTVSRCCWLVW